MTLARFPYTEVQKKLTKVRLNKFRVDRNAKLFHLVFLPLLPVFWLSNYSFVRVGCRQIVLHKTVMFFYCSKLGFLQSAEFLTSRVLENLLIEYSMKEYFELWRNSGEAQVVIF